MVARRETRRASEAFLAQLERKSGETRRRMIAKYKPYLSEERETDAIFGDGGTLNTREEGGHTHADVQTTHMMTVRVTTSTPTKRNLEKKPAKKKSQGKAEDV
ncbi:hypothetical protein GN958_ATG11545 [Phytophthora infestans]|uniref:Uncharacterized protein n=1 Tax=Phytophthora infestans TaxID=4787 RepID=A0A8S9UDQ5_PHYIN|nr:hypothetical protein GN958_ATG11545 [Phytophthora infestans]